MIEKILDLILLNMTFVFAGMFVASQIKTVTQGILIVASLLILLVALDIRYRRARKELVDALESLRNIKWERDHD